MAGDVVEHPPLKARLLICAQCGCLSGLHAAGWRGYRVDDPEDEDVRPEIGFFCPTCASREFGE
jgi:hypothetical protein